MPDAWRAYLEMALGLTETPRKRAQKAVGDLVNRGGATAAQLQGLVEDLMAAGMANREALTNIVRYEVDKALGAVGLATAEEVDELTARVRDLEQELQVARAKPGAGEAAAAVAAGGTRPAKSPPPPKKVAKKAVAKKAVKATPNAMPTAGTTPVSPVAKKAVAKKAVKKAAPVGTATAPAAPVTEAAGGTELPPLTEPVGEALPAAEAAALAQLAGEPAAAPVKKAAAPVKEAAATKAVAKKAPAKKSPAKNAPAKNAVAKKAVAKKAARKAAPAPTAVSEPKTEPEA
jgi:polyhydroxyalkanoate synthesis regulator phasin